MNDAGSPPNETPGASPYPAQQSPLSQPPAPYGSQLVGPQPSRSPQQPADPLPLPPKRRRRRLLLRLAIVLVVLLIILAAAAIALRIRLSEEGVSRKALGPSACVATTSPTSGTGHWMLIEPKTLCGQPQAVTATARKTAQEVLSSTKLIFDPGTDYPYLGAYTSDFAVSYESPLHIKVLRYFNVVGFNGIFKPTVALGVLGSIDENPYLSGDVFHSVPPGPHGGAMECAPVSPFSEECIFATTTTLGDFTFEDSLKELNGTNTDANAIRIRDALEVR